MKGSEMDYLDYLQLDEEEIVILSDQEIDHAIFTLKDYMFDNGFSEEVCESMLDYNLEKGKRRGRES